MQSDLESIVMIKSQQTGTHQLRLYAHARDHLFQVLLGIMKFKVCSGIWYLDDLKGTRTHLSSEN